MILRRGIRRRLALGVVATAALLLPGCRDAARPAGGSRPNFVMITADDMSSGDCAPCGQPRIRTPSLARLAAEGLLFERAFLTSGSCSPSRCSTVTGRYPHSTGAGRLHDPLPPDQVTFLDGLREAGYYVALAGKWHLGKAAFSRFDRVYRESEHGGYEEWRQCLLDRPRGRPFFLWLSASDPHRPYTEGTIDRPHGTDDVMVPPYLPDVTETRTDLARYYDAIGRLDRSVGQALEELDRQGAVADTMVLFLSDNGRPFPRCKPTLYDCGIQTPWIVRFPGRVRPGGRTGSLVSAVDIAPTILELARLRPPATMQGVSFAPILEDPSATIREHVFAEHNWHDHPARDRMVRTARHKYIRNFYPDLPATPPDDVVQSPTYHAMKALLERRELTVPQSNCFVAPRPVEELYDLEADPHELVNLAADPGSGGVLEEMRRLLREWQRETDDRDPAAASREPAR